MNSATFRILLLIILISGLHKISYGNRDKTKSFHTNKIPAFEKSGTAYQESAFTRYFSTKSAKDSTRRTDRSQFYIETDPSALFFKGFSLQLRRSTLLKNKMILSIGYYRAELPEFWINANPENKDKGWSARVRHGVGFTADYHLFQANKGLFTGMDLSLYNFETRRVGLKSYFNSFVPSVRIGYMWRPFNRCVYILPVAAVAYNTKVSGVNTIAGESLTIKKWAFVPTINLGVSF